MQLEVYQTDAEAYEAAAALAAERLVASARSGHASLALPGGRGGRALMLALAGRTEIPWAQVDVYFTDECCLPAGDARRTAAVARESLLGPRGVPAERVHPVAVDDGDPTSAAAAYGELLGRALGAPPVFDLVVVDLGDHGEIAAVTPDGAAARSLAPVVAVESAEVRTEPRVARVTMTGAVLRAARAVIVTATGAARAQALAAALREPPDAVRRPAQVVLPSPTVSWLVDRPAAELLLREARPIADAQ